MTELSKTSKLNLERILADEDIRSSLLYNGKKPGIFKLNADGSLTLGETTFGWWNSFIGCQQHLSFSDLTVHLINFMAGVGKNQNDFALNGLFQDFVNFALKQKDKNRMVDILLTAYLYGYKEIQKDGRKPSVDTVINSVIRQQDVRDLDGIAVLTSDGPVLLRNNLVFQRLK